jgi:hypothetical protein
LLIEIELSKYRARLTFPAHAFGGHVLTCSTTVVEGRNWPTLNISRDSMRMIVVDAADQGPQGAGHRTQPRALPHSDTPYGREAMCDELSEHLDPMVVDPSFGHDLGDIDTGCELLHIHGRDPTSYEHGYRHALTSSIKQGHTRYYSNTRQR